MIRKLLFLPVLALLGPSVALVATAKEKPKASQTIDAILSKEWERQGVKPNPPTSDEVFVRRLYLDVAGRIPTLEETKSFLASRDPGKRGRLIDQLLASEAYVHRFYNYWADIIRLKNVDNNYKVSGLAYGEWLKDSLRTNKPYDQMVREMLTTKGAVWESGAVGFYLRDAGMPLDHLATTIQVFLGTQMVCAQCHDHPFDKWTQMDYYHMAAFTYGMETRERYESVETAKDEMKDLRKTDPEAFKKMERELDQLRRYLGTALQPLRRTMVREDDDLPKLPHDYQYENAEPNQVVSPVTVMGNKVEVSADGNRVDTFADWMTSPENPRFTLVIANRLWKSAFGKGLIEPVDELTDSSVADVPELMEFLEKTMVDVNYSMKSYLRILYNTDAYQRMATTEEIPAGATYAFTGPLLRRMSAEQIWDSFVSLAMGQADERDYQLEELVQNQLASLKSLYDSVNDMKTGELRGLARELSDRFSGIREKTEKLNEEYQLALKEGNEAEIERSKKELREVRSQFERDVRDVLAPKLGEAKLYGSNSKDTALPGQQDRLEKLYEAQEKSILNQYGDDKRQMKERLGRLKDQYKQVRDLAGRFRRASLLPSPAPAGHFLQRFGQADRETIDSGNPAATVPQALDMLNGPAFGILKSSFSVLGKSVGEAASPESRLDVIYLSLLNRKPTSAERDIMKDLLAERGEQDAWEDITYALMNSRQFLFIQ